MRWSARVATVILLALAACDNKQDGSGAGAAASASAMATATATAAPVEAGKPDAAVAMPDRPVPKPQTMVSASAPIEAQQKAIMYMVAMRAPHLDDPAVDSAFANDLANKLKPIALSMDSGGDKARMNRVEVVATGRQIDLLMSGGCDEKTPLRAVVTRAGVPLSTLVSHGVLVVRCNDAKIQCLQSARDPDDVLCTTAPRHK